MVSVGTSGRLSLHRATVHIRRGLRCWQGRFLHLFWYCHSFCFHSQVHLFNTHLPLMSLPIMRRVTCSRSGRRRCAWTWLLQRNVIHDTIKLLNGAAGFGSALSPVLARHTSSLFLWTCFDVLSQPRCYHDAFATARAGCSAGLEGTARAEFFCAFHFIVEPVGGCCFVSIIAGPGVTCKLTRHMTAASILRYFRSMPQVVRQAAAPGWTAARRRRSVDIIAAGPSVVNEACKT